SPRRSVRAPGRLFVHYNADSCPGAVISTTLSGPYSRSPPMSNFLRLAAVLSCLGVPILGAVFLNAIGLLLPSVQTSAAKKTVFEELKLKEQLRQHQEAFQRSKQVRLQVAEEVIAGRLSVADALEAFRRLQGQRLPNITKQDVLKPLEMSEA